MTWCQPHTRRLEDAIDLRGLESSPAPGAFDALAHAREALVTHATNFAGQAAVELLTGQHCPICFINRNPAGVICDDWIELAADEALAASAHVRSAPSLIVV